MLGALRHWGKWSVIDDVRLPNIILEDIAFAIRSQSEVNGTEIPEGTKKRIHLLICLNPNLKSLCDVSKQENRLIFFG